MRRPSHFGNDLVDGGRQFYQTKNSVNGVTNPTAFPEQHTVSAQFELYFGTRTQTKLVANLDGDRDLPLGGNRTLHR